MVVYIFHVYWSRILNHLNNLLWQNLDYGVEFSFKHYKFIPQTNMNYFFHVRNSKWKFFWIFGGLGEQPIFRCNLQNDEFCFLMWLRFQFFEHSLNNQAIWQICEIVNIWFQDINLRKLTNSTKFFVFDQNIY